MKSEILTEPQGTADDVNAAKREVKARCCAVALAHTPLTVRMIVVRKSLSGRAYYATGVMHTPRPFTRNALYIFLHECAHFALDHGNSRAPVYLKELEAEKWAHARMRVAGIPVPRKMTRRAKKYVAMKIRRAVRREAD